MRNRDLFCTALASFNPCKKVVNVYNKSTMRHFRLIAGFLTLSLALGGVLGDVLHIQEKSEAEASHHLVAHADNADVSDTIDTISSESGGESCYETSSQVAITTPCGQRTTTTEAIGVIPSLITKITYYQTEVPLTFKGRAPPLFEHASSFAATVSMRV